MKITKNSELIAKKVIVDGAKGVSMRILLGEEHGSNEIIIRSFIIEPAGYSLHHKHNYEHLVQITKGSGIFIDDDGRENHVTVGQNIFIGKDEMHQFQNKSGTDFKFTCTILNKK